MSNSFIQKVPAITLLIAVAMLVGCQETNQTRTDGATGSDSPGLTTVSANDTPSPSSKAHLSPSAKKVEKLLSDGKPRAAEKLLDAYVPQFPDDGGLYAMKAQLLLLESDIINDYTAPQSRMHLIKDACRTAVEFDPRLKPFVAEMLWRQVITDLENAADVQNPIVFADLKIVSLNYASEIQNGNHSPETTAQMMDLAAVPMMAVGIQMKLGHCMHPGGWQAALNLAHELDPETSTEWSKQLRGLSSEFADAELYASGMFVEIIRTYYECINQDERPALTLKVLVDRLDKIKSSIRLKKRASAAFDELVAFAWEDEIVALVKRQPADSKIRQLFQVLTE